METWRIFSEVYNGHRNFMTPNIMEYFRTKKYAIELSHGRGISNQDIYGVTVIELSDINSRSDKSQLFQSLSQAKNYIACLEREI